MESAEFRVRNAEQTTNEFDTTTGAVVPMPQSTGVDRLIGLGSNTLGEIFAVNSTGGVSGTPTVYQLNPATGQTTALFDMSGPRIPGRFDEGGVPMAVI